jgi:type 1 glutamine amidotransferase
MRSHRAVPRLSVVILCAAVALVFVGAGADGLRAAGDPQGRGGRGRGGPAAPAEPRINALVVSGGCCHDYGYQGRMLMEAVNNVLPVDWTVAYQGSSRSTTTRFPIYRDENWARGFDIVVHNECSADVADEAFIHRITDAHRAGGVAALVIHCAMHSYRTATIDDWRELLGVTSRRHTASHQISVKLTPAAAAHPAMAGFRPDWVTPVDELYVIDKIWPGATALATAVSPEDQREYPLVWASDYHGARVFGTTLGHGNATWGDPTFQDLIARGFKWAVGR